MLHQLEDGLRILQRHVALGVSDAGAGWGAVAHRLGLLLGLVEGGLGGGVALVRPGRSIVLAGRWVVAAEEPIGKAEFLLYEERRVRVVLDVGVVEKVVLQ